MRIPPNFLSKSRVLHLVCTPTGVYSRKGGPVVLIFCFSKLFLCGQLWKEMDIMLVLYSGIFIAKEYLTFLPAPLSSTCMRKYAFHQQIIFSLTNNAPMKYVSMFVAIIIIHPDYSLLFPCLSGNWLHTSSIICMCVILSKRGEEKKCRKIKFKCVWIDVFKWEDHSLDICI